MKKILALAAALGALAAHAQTTVSDAWTRGTVAGQRTTGVFAKITSTQGGRLLSVASPLAGVAEIHEMAMDGNVMKMRAVTAVDLPAGKTVELKPGGYHVMLMDLKQPLKEGESIPLTLVFEDAAKVRSSQTLQAPVRALGAAAMPAKPMDHGHHGGHGQHKP